MGPPRVPAATINMEGPSPFIAVVLGGQDFLDPATVTTDTYSYALTDNRLASIAEAGGHTRTFTYDAAGNTTYDNRSGGGYGYTYDALGRMASFAINGVVQAEYEYNAQGQQVVRRLTQSQQTIHNVFDLDGNRIAEYLYDEVAGTSTLIREYVWLNGQVIGVWEGGQLFYVRSDHVGRPVFATNDLGFKVWEASYLPFGGVEASSGPSIGLRFPGQWFQSESGLHQNWMRDYDPTTGRYLQADPLGLVDGASVYGYALQNPGRYVDPRGEAILPAMIAGATVGALAGYLTTGCIDGAVAGAIIGAGTGMFATGSAASAVYQSMLASGTGQIVSFFAVEHLDRNCSCDPVQWNWIRFFAVVAGGGLGGLGGYAMGAPTTSTLGGVAGGDVLGPYVGGLIQGTFGALGEAVGNDIFESSPFNGDRN